MKIRKHVSILMGLALACGLVSCFNDTAFDIIKNPHLFDTLPFKIPIPSGAALWADTEVSAPDESSFNSVAVGSEMDQSTGSAIAVVYAAGYIHGKGTYDFNNGVTATGAADALHNVVLVKYVNGKAQWARTVSSGTYASEFNSVAVGSDGVYAAGRINSKQPFDFGNSKTVAGTAPSPNKNIVLAKYDFNGNTQWVKSLSSGPNNDSEFNSVAVGSDGSVYAAGYITNNTPAYNFGSGDVPNAGLCTGSNIIVVKYNPVDGSEVWAKSVTTGLNDSGFNSVAVGSDGVYAAGYIANTSTFDFGNSQTATGLYSGNNIILVKYSLVDGSAMWAKTVTTGPNASAFNSVAVGSEVDKSTGSAIEVVYAAGYIYGESEYKFGGVKGGVKAHGPFNIGNNTLLVKYDSDGYAKWVRAVASGSNASEINSVSVGGNGVYIAGYITGNSTYNFGNFVTATGAASTGKNLFVMKYGPYGKAQWARTVSHGFASQYNSVSATPDGIYTGGSINGSTMFDFGYNVTINGSAAGSGVSGVVLVKYKP